MMNEWDVEDLERRFYVDETPHLREAARVLARLVDWTNRNSDGWCYWPKPSRAAKSLMTLLEAADRYDPVDVTATQLTKALSPVKAFLTRQGVAHEEVLGR